MRVKAIWWRSFLAAGLVCVALYPLIHAAVWQDVAYVAIGLTSVAAIGVGVWLNRPTLRTPWILMGAGQLSWVVGDAVDSWHQDFSHSVGYPSLADAFYLLAYPILAAGLLSLIRARRPRRDVAGFLDSATLTTGLGLLSWTMIGRPTLAEWHHAPLASAVGLAYPVADIILLGGLIRLVTTPGGRTPALRFLIGAVGLLIAADSVSAGLSLYSSVNADRYDFIWLLSYVAWGTAALHGSMRVLSEPTMSDDVTFSRKRLAAMCIATLIAPGTLAVESATGRSIDVWSIAVGSVTLFMLVVGRMSVAIDQIVVSHRQREALQEELAYQAVHDSLTGLPNRAQAMRMIEAALSRAQRTGSLVALLFVDLDGFKAVNDTLGHRTGDEVLRVIARRFASAIRGGDSVARLGGDEFVIVLEQLADEHEAGPVADRLIAVACEAIPTEHGEARVGASVGIALSQDGHVDAARFLHEADTAVYRAKSSGRGRAAMFDDAVRKQVEERASLEVALKKAIAEDELEVYYQPIIEVKTDRVHGYEALVRWNRPGFGVVSPADFIPVAETSSLICDVDRWVLDHALIQQATWASDGLETAGQLLMSVNISATHVSRRRVIDDVTGALRSSGVDPTRLVIEITETALLDDVESTHNLNLLRELGVLVSIDDFGVGYSSIARLRDLPIDIVKIDRAFLDTTQRGTTEILQLMISAAHAFGLPVIVEGIEEQEQLDRIRVLDCEGAQGFYFAPPRPARVLDAAGSYVQPAGQSR